MSSLKPINDNNKLDIHKSQSEPYCTQWKEDILFEFGHITNCKNYSYDSLIKADASDKKAIKCLFEFITKMSKSNWVELSTRRKENIGGFETLTVGQLNSRIHTIYSKEFTDDVKLHVFRFGNKDKYRLIGYKSKNCSRVLHVLAFDLDFTLYDHGN